MFGFGRLEGHYVSDVQWTAVTRQNLALRTVFLACPYGQIGGGMGSIMSSLAAFDAGPSGRFHLVCLETRGGGHIILSPFYLLRAIGRIVVDAVGGRLAVVHINLADGTSVYRKALVLFASRLAGTSVLLHLHAGRLVSMYENMTAPGKMLLRTIVRKADHCVVLKEQWYHWVIETLGAKPSAISVVCNGVPATTLPRKPQAEGAPFRFLFVGNLLPNKGAADLLHAFALPELRNSPVTLTLVGGGPVDQVQSPGRPAWYQRTCPFHRMGLAGNGASDADRGRCARIAVLRRRLATCRPRGACQPGAGDLHPRGSHSRPVRARDNSDLRRTRRPCRPRRRHASLEPQYRVAGASKRGWLRAVSGEVFDVGLPGPNRLTLRPSCAQGR